MTQVQAPTPSILSRSYVHQQHVPFPDTAHSLETPSQHAFASHRTQPSPPHTTSTASHAWRTSRPAMVHAGSGGNTELRAQIRKEREAGRAATGQHKARQESTGACTSIPSGPEIKPSLSLSTLSATGAESSLSSKAITEGTDSTALTSAELPATEVVASQKQMTSKAASVAGKEEVAGPQPSNSQPQTSASAKRLSTGSAVLAAVRKLEEDARSRDIHHHTFQVARSTSTISMAENPSRSSKEQQRVKESDFAPVMSSSVSDTGFVGSPPESFDHSFGVDALQAAFSAKYYELAHKCKNWERYAAQLRARLEALDIDNRILRETSAAQQRQIVFLEAENAALKDQSEMRELRACEVEQRLTLLEERLSGQAFHNAMVATHGSNFAMRRGSVEALQALPTVEERTNSAASSPEVRSVSRGTSRSGAYHSDASALHSSNLIAAPDRHSSIRAPTPLNRVPSHNLKEATRFQPHQRLPTLSSVQHDSRDGIVIEDAALREHARLSGEGQEDPVAVHPQHLSRSQQQGVPPGPATSKTGLTGSQSMTTLQGSADDFATQQSQQYTHAAPSLRSSASFVRVRPSHGPRSVTSPAYPTMMAGQKRPPTTESTFMAQPSGHIQVPSHLHNYPHRPFSGHSNAGSLPKMRSDNSLGVHVAQFSTSVPSLYPEATGMFNHGAMRSSRSISATDVQQGREGTSAPTLASRHRSVTVGGQALQEEEEGEPPHRTSGSSSDAGTAMSASGSQSGENLPLQTGQRRRLRRTSLNQQQQFAQMQAQREAAFAAAGGYSTRPPSRSASRASNASNEGVHGVSARNRSSSARASRSRAGSASVHDSIPAVKDDLFSDGTLTILEDVAAQQNKVISHSQSYPVLGPRASLGSLGAPPLSASAIANANSRHRSPLVPLNNLINVEHLHNRIPSIGQVATSASDSALLPSGKRQFDRTSSNNSMGGSSIATSNSSLVPTNASLARASSGSLSHAHQATTLSTNSSQLSISKAYEFVGEGGEEQASCVVPTLSRHQQNGSEDSSYVEHIGVTSSEQTSDATAPLALRAMGSPGAGESDELDEEKKGAHRRLYVALREELSAEHLIKFERYVHRYDAMEIPIDGARGLINRVKSLLLLADPTLRERPDDLRRRKKLAREFERIVRVDLGDTSQQ